MKVRELLKELQSYNPDSEIVIDGTGPVYFVEELPGYYDGYYSEHILGEKVLQGYNIEGIHYTRAGSKVILKTMDLEDIVWNVSSPDEVDKIKVTFDPTMHQGAINSISEKFRVVKEEIMKYFNEGNK